MLSINMRIFKTVLLLVAFGLNVQCLPLTKETSTKETSLEGNSLSNANPNIDHYDQRQNGTENYRVHVDGIVFVIAPMEALVLSAAAANDPNLSLIDALKPTEKPKPEAGEAQKPSPAPKSANRSGMHLANLIAPLLRHIRRE